MSAFDATILANMKDAQENGYEMSCSYCGCGIYDETDGHDYWCPTQTAEFKAEQEQAEAEFAARIARATTDAQAAVSEVELAPALSDVRDTE